MGCSRKGYNPFLLLVINYWLRRDYHNTDIRSRFFNSRINSANNDPSRFLLINNQLINNQESNPHQ